MDESGHFLAGGRWLPSHSPERIPVINPANGRRIGDAPTGCSADVASAVDAAVTAFPSWRDQTVAARLALLKRLRGALSARASDLALLITREMGTPIGFSRSAQLGLPLRTFDVVTAAMEALEDLRTPRSDVHRDPVGVVAAITPWNFPLHQVAAKVVPALAAGCTLVLKPSELTPLDARAFAELVESCGFPPGVFNLVHGGAETGAALAAHPGVDMVTFTGSTAAGRQIAAQAGRDLKKVTLELGGKSANLLFDDVDLEKVIPQAVAQCFVNGGQTCAALTRLLVPRALKTQAEALAVAAAAAWQPGNPEVDSTRLGPLASEGQRDRVRERVARAIAEGTQLLSGGLDQPRGFDHGAWFLPTVITNVRPDMSICREEVFGPVLVILGYDDEDEAIAVANDSAYGLSAGVWSVDLDRAERVARRLHTGQVILNGAMLDLEAPFGGVGASGIGRENGRFGLAEFFSLKAITRPTVA